MEDTDRKPRRGRVTRIMLWFLAITAVVLLVDSRLQGRVTPSELASMIAAGETVTVIDTRSQAEFDQAHVPGAVHIPFWQAFSRASELRDMPGPFVIYCEHGPRASLARLSLRLAGVGDMQSLRGHYSAWRAADLPAD